MNNHKSKVVQEITTERQRQIENEGWSVGHDDDHHVSDLTDAALCYEDALGDFDSPEPNHWPWERKWWKPKDRRRNLIRSGALYLAARDWCQRRADRVAEQIDRLDRAK